MKINELKKQILNNKFNSTLADIYYDDSEMIDYQKNRYINALSKYENFFDDEDVEIYSAPGRTEVGGNHTDHQHGMVLAASINLDAIAIVGKATENTIELIVERAWRKCSHSSCVQTFVSIHCTFVILRGV